LEDDNNILWDVDLDVDVAITATGCDI